MEIFDLCIFLLVAMAGLKIADSFDVTDYDRRILRWLWGYHLLFGVIFWAYISFGAGGDAYGYWAMGRYIPFPAIFERMWTEPTYFIIALCYFPAGVLGLSFFATSMLFCLAGYIGVAMFYVLYERLVPFNSRIGGYDIFPMIFFLPNMHFWSSGLGKDSLLFMCIGLFFFSLQKPLKYIPGLLISLGLSYLVRPHITFFMLIAVGVGFLMDGRLKTYQKVIAMSVFAAVGFWVFGKMADFLKIQEMSSEQLSNFTQSRVSNLSRASVGSAVDIGSYPLPLKVFTFLFRPLFFDARNVMSLAASAENLLLFVMFCRMVASKPLAAFKQGGYIIKSSLFFVIFGSVACSMIMSNLGIIMRQKNMFVPLLLLFIGWVLAQKERLQGIETEPT